MITQGHLEVSFLTLTNILNISLINIPKFCFHSVRHIKTSVGTLLTMLKL